MAISLKFCVNIILASIIINSESIQAAKILLFPFGHCINSHLLNVEKLAGVLLEGGHQVSFLVPSTYHGPYSDTDFSDIKLIHFPAPKNMSPICDFNTLQEFLVTPFHKILQTFYKSTYAFCEALVAQQSLLNKIKQDGYDLAIYDAVDQCSKILADYIDIPFIVFHTSGFESILPRHPAYLPTMLTSYTDEMHLGQRVANTLSYLAQKVIVYFTYSYYQELKDKYHLNSSISVYHSFDRASLRFILGEYGMDYVGPTQPSYVMVGGFIQPDSKPIPQRIQEFINRNDDDDHDDRGVVLVSFGSIARNYGPEWREVFANALGRLPYKVIWRYNEEAPKSLGNNTMLIPWLPQSEILAQPQVKSFITHCGLNAAYEASYHGTPVVAIPLFADQFFQASKLTKHVKMGMKIDIKSLDSDKLYQAIMAVSQSEEYKQNAAQVSYVMQNRPWSQKETILKWVDYVVMHNGAKHLRSQEHGLEWYQYFLLDVALVICMVLLILLGITFYTCRLTLRFVRSKAVVIRDLMTDSEVQEKLLATKDERSVMTKSVEALSSQPATF